MWRTIVPFPMPSGWRSLRWRSSKLRFRGAADEISTEVDIGLLALGFTALGLWVGHRLTARKPSAPFERNAAAIASLELTRRECEILDLWHRASRTRSWRG